MQSSIKHNSVLLKKVKDLKEIFQSHHNEHIRKKKAYDILIHTNTILIKELYIIIFWTTTR